MTDTNKKEKLESAFDKALSRADEAVAENTETVATDGEQEEVASAATDSDKNNDEMKWPLPVYPLVAKFDVQIVELEEENAVVLAIYTGAGATFGLLSREGTLALASKLKKAGQSMIPGAEV